MPGKINEIGPLMSVYILFERAHPKPKSPIASEFDSVGRELIKERGVLLVMVMPAAARQFFGASV